MKALYFENTLWKAALLGLTRRLSDSAPFWPGSPLRHVEIPEPEIPNPRWLKVRNRCCGLCGTDIHFMFMDLDPRCFSAAMPGVARKFLGHEALGELIEAGSEADGFEVGDRVVLRIDWPSCHQLEIEPPCRQCAAGNYMLCEKIGQAALPIENTGGGFSPRMVLHRTQPYKVPQALSDDAAVLIEPMACAVHGVLKAPPQPGESVLIIGGGTLGLLSIAALCGIAPEARVHALVRHAFQAERAEKLGAHVILEKGDVYQSAADASGARYCRGPFDNRILLGGFDVVYDTVGNDASLNQSLRLARGGGAVVLMGIHFHPGRIDYSPVWCQEVRLLGINCHANEPGGRNSFDVAAQLLQQGVIDPADLITHRFPMSELRQAVNTFLSKRDSQAIKIVLDHS